MSDAEIRREVLIDADPERVWAALTEQEMLEQWLADEVELEPRVGGRVEMRDGDGAACAGVVERVRKPSELVFRWRDGEGIESRVRLEVDAVAGGSRLVVVESRTQSPLQPAAATVASLTWGLRLADVSRLVVGRVLAGRL